MDFAVSAARWSLSKALAPATASVLKAWAASKNLGGEVDALMAQLLYVQAMLHQTDGREIDNPCLNELLVMLRLLAYDADDVLDELDYFRIQDELDSTYHAADTHAGNCVQGLLHHAHHTAKAILAQLKPSCLPWIDNYSHSDIFNDINTTGNEGQVQTVQTPKLEFDRVAVSLKMAEVVQKLKPICRMVSDILDKELQGSTYRAATTMERPITSEDSLEPKLYGREIEKQRVVDSITGKYSTKDLTVLPIVGPGGIGKTTFAQHVYQEVKSHFEVTVWICVSLNSNANRLVQEARNKIPSVQGEKQYSSDKETIEQRLKGKRFLLVLDDIWRCDEDEWEQLLSPFRQGGGEGSMVIVTTRMLDVANIVKTNDSQIELDRLGAKEFREFFDSCVSTKNEIWSDHPELLETGEEIVVKLKGSPLAAKTVGRLLRKQLTLQHWRRVLKHKEWEQQTSDNDIMPALKVSYDHLPLNLKQCFSYCSLFPEDYEFEIKELIQFWIGLGVLSPGDQNMRIEDVGKRYILSLVNYGFLKKYEKENGQDYYVIHDLLHELAVKVSQEDCVSIKVSEVGYRHIPPSVRHLSIVLDNRYIDTVMYKHLQEDLSLLKEKLQVETLRTLMVFGQNMDSFSKTFGNLLQQARVLRTIFLSEGSYIVEDMLRNFSNLVHLLYLKIKGQRYLEMNLPITISRLYHLKILDTEGCWRCSIPSKDLSNLVNMQHLDAHHMEICSVGKMKFLREVRNFRVKNEPEGFELKELGKLLEVEVLGLYGLERVKSRGEASELKLHQKHNLQELVLDWTADRADKDTMQEDTVLESLRPNESLLKLSIKGHGGATCPSWLGVNIIVKTLEFLELNDVQWTSFPPLGELWIIDELGAECKSHMLGQGFRNLRRLELVKIPKLRKWAGNGPSQLFSHLEGITIRECPELTEVAFSDPAWFPKLEEVEITDCPKLQSLPCIPWSSATRSATFEHAGSEIERLSFKQYSDSQFMLDITGRNPVYSPFWSVLNSDNLSNIGILALWRCPPLPLAVLRNLSTLEALDVVDSGEAFCLTDGDNHVRGLCPAEYLTIAQCGANGQQLTHILSYFPKLEHFTVGECENLTGFSVPGQQIGVVDQQTGDEEIAAASSGVLLLPPKLLSLKIHDLPNLVLCSTDQTGEGGWGLQFLSFLQMLWIEGCPKLLYSYSSSSSCSSRFPFPASLDNLYIKGTFGADTLLPLSNLTSLTSLRIWECGELRGEGLWSLLAEGCLTYLTISETPNFFTVSEPSLPSLPPKLKTFEIEGIAKVLTVPICSLLSSSLTHLNFSLDKELERFTKQQEEALQQLTSLDEIIFQWCDKLQGLPPCLYRIPNLKRLIIFECVAIRSLPKVGLPSALQELQIEGCPAIQSLPKDRLPSSLQRLVIRRCPAIQSIPKVDDLPSSLHELDVQNSESKELIRQCRKLIGTIPIVRA